MKESNRASLLGQILLIVGLIAVSGALGFYWCEKDVVRSPPFERLTIWDSLWWVMVTMTTIGYGDIYPFTLAGRLIALILMFVGIGALGVSTAAIAAYFIKNDQLQLLRLRQTRGHVVICGLGEKGLLLTRAFRERNQPVVVIEENEANDFIASCREMGAIVLIGDATEHAMLLLARVPQARYLVGVCGDDGANAQIAAIAHELAGGRAGRRLRAAFTSSTPTCGICCGVGNWPKRVRFAASFSTFSTSARALCSKPIRRFRAPSRASQWRRRICW